MSDDPRIHVSLAHLRALQREAHGLSFLPHQSSRSVLNGRHTSRLRGRGLNFEEMRNYTKGDDIRSIDWKATARTGKPHVRVFSEERDRPALLVVDQRMSMFYGSVHNMKSVTAAEAAAIAAFGILAAGDRIGGIVFDDQQQLEIVPKRSSRAVFALLEAIAQMNGQLHADRPAKVAPGSLNKVLQAIARLAHHDHLIIVLSDFDGIDETTRRRLSGIAAHNDLVLGLVYDPSAKSLSQRMGQQTQVVIGDGQQQAQINFSQARVVESVQHITSERLRRIEQWQHEINLSVLPISAGEPTLAQLRRLLGDKAQGKRVRAG